VTDDDGGAGEAEHVVSVTVGPPTYYSYLPLVLR